MNFSLRRHMRPRRFFARREAKTILTRSLLGFDINMPPDGLMKKPVRLLYHRCCNSELIAVAGGTSGLGRAIIDALKSDGSYEVLVLSRRDNKIRVLNANNYSDVDQLQTLLDRNGIQAVISIFSGPLGSPGEPKLIEAAEHSSTTKRFIPSLFSGLPFTDEHSNNPFLASHVAEFAVIHPGIFMDYYVPLPTHVAVLPITVSLSAKYAAIPGSGNVPVSFRHTSSTGKYPSRLLAKPPGTWQKRYFILEDNRTWNVVVALAEKHMRVKFEVVYDSLEKTNMGEISQIPGIEVLYESFGGGGEARRFMMGWLAGYAQWMEKGHFWYQQGPLLSKEFNDVIEKLTFKKVWEIAGNESFVLRAT
ncbi:hypothetical protein COCMIDRAFT_32342 [Bipolaris oryzae ATCC 44560]|uniref:NmrA-like domain-containing protein n=1 Tax=Bipolaris oryzae ATCC 44560 TaxID=930090 RepID=W6ZJN1_COCMI|nr:uncharacterized protein COCMIDRAFT_32342 [Bipolaris oryzae ATCC 44560]EUC50245.1 hypothetical protein COCMIDRAFT_32342 [Bipolaris oryzae ATCC 44560]